MARNRPGTDAMQPDGGARPHHGRVAHSSDGKVLTEDAEPEKE